VSEFPGEIYVLAMRAQPGKPTMFAPRIRTWIFAVTDRDIKEGDTVKNADRRLIGDVPVVLRTLSRPRPLERAWQYQSDTRASDVEARKIRGPRRRPRTSKRASIIAAQNRLP